MYLGAVGPAVDGVCACVCSSSLEAVCASVCTVQVAAQQKQSKHVKCCAKATATGATHGAKSRYRSRV